MPRPRPAPLLALLCALLPAFLPSAAQARRGLATVAALQGHLAHELSLAGAQSGAYVYDLSTDRTLFSERAQQLHPPASVEKLYTATTALERLGADARLETTVLGAGHLVPGGVWEGDLYLHGGGDPTFGSTLFIAAHYGGLGTSVSELVAQLIHTAGIHRVTGSIEGDESYLDPLRGEPSSGYQLDPYLEGTLSALAFNRGETGHYHGAHAPAEYAAHELRHALLAAGVAVHGGSGAATTPAGAIRLAVAPSPTIAQLLGLMLPPSDNFFAETLLKDLGARYGGAGTTAAGAHLVRETLATDFGLRPHVVDGSGLSREDETSPLQVVTLLKDLATTPLGTTLRADMAVAGHSGTLAERMRGSAAAGRCQGKTGTLTGVSNLVGYCQDLSGQYLAFAFFNDGIAIETAHALQDNMAIALADY
ncbi:MAG TPA: D-alanyl-D-alanine carboxypeptidase/D-alanyl-D-alanine-endopeptidase [Solirubrobacteraceae bacterium]|nr:D-alanyl-D-alanine carboxypeptidase/D-alanyl-D-alanine-endopeptidase [Solirubrobacteraceae bacterium]